MKNIEFELLFNNKELTKNFADLIYKNWSHLRPDSSYEDLLTRIRSKVSNNRIPIHIIAKNNNEFVAGLIIKENEMTQFPDFKYWIGSVVVEPKYQNKKIATKLLNYSCELAKEKNINKLYLQTEYLNGGLYIKLGWKPVCRLEDKGDQVLVMVKEI
tara:strand:- start:105 stop:575 length:471 start_codon:yes stop_codon:yes gene_type:complete